MTVDMDKEGKRGHRPKGHSIQTDDTARVPKLTKEDSPTTHQPSSDAVTVVSHKYTAAFFAKWNVSSTDALLLLVISLVALVVRCYRLSIPAKVVFDEVHFGKFAGKYLNGTYFYDLHPPLAKMMFAAAGKLAGYDGVFDFKSIGLDYEAASVPYVGMRLLPAILGAITVPATYVVVRACGYKIDTAALASLLVCFENGLITQSRLILLDSPLVFFTVLSLTTWTMFWTQQDKPFTRTWWFWLLATGAMMGCAASCKWVGLFLFPAIGLSTIADLWNKIADLSISPRKWFAHFFARALALLAVPLAVYLFWFQVHFAVLYKTGDAKAMMSPEFQTTLEGGLNVTTDRDVFYGSEIRMRSTNGRSGYLHSHTHNWQHEKGSGQQQVTIYGFADQNNIWIVEPAYNKTIDTSNGPVPVMAGDVIRLRHKITDKFLHSHDKKPALTSDDNKFELSGYGFPGFDGDTNDNFRLEILSGDKTMEGSDKMLQSIYSRFRLIHTNLGCAVFNSRKKLPKWAFEQTEVNCMRNCMPRMSTWHVEYAHLPNNTDGVRKAEYRPLSVWGKILEYNKMMASSNAGLTGDHPFAARPQHWPWLRRGTAYWGGYGNFIYQLGNPPVWWASLASVLLLMAVRVLLFLLDKRQIRPSFGGQRAKYLSAAGFFTISWLCHYIPFFLMGRELFIHHYFPALWMAILVLAFTLDLFTARLPAVVRWSVYLVAASITLYAFETFSYITYARVWTKDVCMKSKWLNTWDIDCEHAIGGARSTEQQSSPVAGADTGVNGSDAKQRVFSAEAAGGDAINGADKSASAVESVYVEPEFVNTAAGPKEAVGKENMSIKPPVKHVEL
ncbi:Dolichyl-phosphate-mannose--protein mannosyltransferase 1 [Coemansia spiralis]|uniref:Dolichyl-phosphate-mannose--protein mannosyltransferase n=2 Tax=Coemansia TaxID=4863 RepID=A0A9W8G5Q8_9FUNG|nr:Dolichyl-phosphate-mannose-protein mannosyltransferase-domain-containing protein [Coemansia spiralis]KAJ1992046.1 Dolichyl-phosphate-mannose--protein mannosyltransferase 1 [Coemansia umbellata]KAJ2674425.1 Dolichyl-phosphate-mannose--protein mannosyltransferase 1 [Coemansia spiralis]